MQRAQKQGGESGNAQRTAQAKFTSKSRENEQANAIDDSPAMTAQRKKLQSLFGGAIQRVEDEEPLQGKFETAQRVEEEEPLQGKFEAVQRVEEEEPLQGKFEAVQRVEEEEPLQGKFETAQRVEEEEPLQGKFEAASSVQLKEESAKPNNTGLPDNLKSGIESLSGMSMDNVKVHYNSSQPAQLNALAYAQGTDIHVAPGQEQHLPHEAWHVVQQAQGRVKPTMQMKEGVPVNDDKSLEHEADVMGGEANRLGPPAQLMAAAAEFAEKHMAISEDDAKSKTENRTGKLGPAKKNSVLNYGDANTKKAFDDDATASGPAKVAAKGWEIEADRRGPGRKIVNAEAKTGNFKVTVSKGEANHCDGWE